MHKTWSVILAETIDLWVEVGYNVFVHEVQNRKVRTRHMESKLLKKILSRDFLIYLVFGVLTTAVNYLVFTAMLSVLGQSMALVVNAIAFIAAVLVAFLTNKPFVFHSNNWHWKVVIREFSTFVGSRLVTFGIEEVGLWIYQMLPGMDQWSFLGLSGLLYAKLVLSVIVVLLNYIISKWLVFRKSNHTDGGSSSKDGDKC